MAATVTQDSDLALQLQNIVQPKLVEAGWSTGDSTLAEYIVLMLVNGKDKDQVASELSNDLLGLGPDDDSAKEFAQWLFDQVAMLNGQVPSVVLSSDQPSTLGQPIPTGPSSDADMAGNMDLEQTQNIPTGPKSMRSGPGGQRGSGRRIMGHVNRALDRANDSLHKVRNNSTERIGRHTPRGPRGGMQAGQFKSGPGGVGGRGGSHLPAINAQQQNQLMQFMNQQMEMMQQMLTGQGSPGMMNMNGAAINPNFRGRSLADRVNGGQRGGGKFGDRRNNHGNQTQQNTKDNTAQPGDTEMGGDTAMEPEITTNNQPNPDTTICRFNLKCTKVDCPFAHQSPAAPPGTTVDTSDTCGFGAACQNRKCVAKHPSPARRTQFQAEQECKFWPNCTNQHCPFKHPSMPMCRFGGDCNKEDCKFTHVRTMCKYNPCMNPHCYFKHAEGQKKGSTWVNKERDGDVKMGADHVSERKFVTEDGGLDEELIKPAGSDATQVTDIVT